MKKLFGTKDSGDMTAQRDTLYDSISKHPNANHTHTVGISGYDRFILWSDKHRGLLLQAQNDAEGINISMHGCREFGYNNRLDLSVPDEKEAFLDLLRRYF